MGRQVLIDEDRLNDIADSIRKMKGTHDLITVDSMAREIEEAEIVWDPEEKWVRPLDWPDYSQIDLTNFEGMYFTYDTSGADHYDDWVGLYCVCSGGYKVERGQIVNGAFVAEYTTTKSSGAIFEEWIESTITGYVVYRITAATAGQPITSIGLRSMTTTLRTDGRTSRDYTYQSILERYGRLPNLTSFSNWGSIDVISDTILDLKSLTSLNAVWYCCYAIENINIQGYDSSVTTCSNAFGYCRRLKYLNETDKLVTSSCTNMYCMFNDCNVLKFVDCANWDTSNVTRMDSLFSSCYNLYKADVSNWDVSKVTIMTYIFQGCRELKQIDVSKWIVTLPTSYYSFFNGCSRVEKLDLSGFDSTNVTTMYAMFNGCYALEELIFDFNTSKCDNMYAMFSGCRQLNTIDVSNFDTSKVTNFGSMFSGATNLKNIDISNFDFSSATVMTSFLNSASIKIKQLNLPQNMITNKIVGTNMDSLFSSLNSLGYIDLSDCDMSGVTAPASVFRYCYQLETIILPTSLKYVGTYFFANCTNLKTIVLPSTTVVSLLNTNAFTSSNRAKTIYVPDNLVASYRTASNWSSLSNVTFAGLSTYTE